MPMKKTLRVALYGRGSAGSPKPAPQLRESCDHYGWQIVREYVGYKLGRKGSGERHDFDKRLAEAGHREFDLVYFWRLNRFSREGIKKTFDASSLLRCGLGDRQVLLNRGQMFTGKTDERFIFLRPSGREG